MSALLKFLDKPIWIYLFYYLRRNQWQFLDDLLAVGVLIPYRVKNAAQSIVPAAFPNREYQLRYGVNLTRPLAPSSGVILFIKGGRYLFKLFSELRRDL